MSHTAPRLSETELSQRILDMAKTGVYRESIFEAFQPCATKKQIRDAIAYAKQFGLHSVRQMRDAELGTYYQIDVAKYEAGKAALAVTVPLTTGEDLATRLVAMTQAMRTMLAIAAGSAFALLILGGICLVTGHLQSGRLAWVSAASIGGIWLIQQRWTRALL